MVGLRGSKRIPLELPVQVRWKAPTGRLRQARGKTADMSGTGLYMVIPARLRPGKSLTFTIRLPEEITKVPTELVCRGQVVRQSRSGAFQGIAAIIEEYQLRPVLPPKH